MQFIFTGIIFISCLLSFYSCKKAVVEAATTPATPLANTQDAVYRADVPYKLVWSDEFNHDGLVDTTKWSYDEGGNGWGNRELQYYTKARSENARISNGNLVIEARKEIYNGNKYYTSARLNTKYAAQWTYGKFEIKAKIPKGTGTWPTIWMLSGKEPMKWPDDGELDIMEAVGYNANVINGVAHTLLYNGANGLYKTGNMLIPDAQEAFHVYSIEWTDKKITWSIDGAPYFSYSDPGLGSGGWPFNTGFYMIFNIAIGGNYGGKNGVDDSIFPQQMLVDYIRVYQRKP